MSSTCEAISTFPDQLVEPPEVFNVAIISADEAVEAGMAAQVTIGDSNTGDVLVSLDQAVYQGLEGDNVTVCLLVQAGGVTDITRSVVLRVSTQSDTAQGMKGGGGGGGLESLTS